MPCADPLPKRRWEPLVDFLFTEAVEQTGPIEPSPLLGPPGALLRRATAGYFYSCLRAEERLGLTQKCSLAGSRPARYCGCLPRVLRPLGGGAEPAVLWGN